MVMNKQRPLISVIMPIFNAREFLSEAINSVLSQSLENLELLLIDDGSTDGSSDLCQKAAKSDFRIRYFKITNGGVSRARNFGIKESNGDFIAFIDADDIYHKDKLRIQYEALTQRNLDAVFCGIKRFISKKDVILFHHESFVQASHYENFFESLYLLLDTEKYAIFHTILIRRELLLFSSLYDTALKTGEDWDLWLRISRYCSFGFLQQSLFFYRKHENSVTNKLGNRFTLKAHLKILKKNYEFPITRAQYLEAVTRKHLEFFSHSMYSKNDVEFFLLMVKSAFGSLALFKPRYYEIIKDRFF